ncbi:hypothetical protein I6I97_17455 [Sphingobacterium multivorum]|uniref:hypothetical protein n=1 Tax=Sphingobacterium multivorum TaxID=28454 RepID=UPI0019187DFD|nr:hypothetical protein [Sphingobacterium multivorum]QQT60988.1 hypothetical protein I6I97_17455 [Sphingobacterium multivorum]
MAVVIQNLSVVIENAKTQSYSERMNESTLIDLLLDNILDFKKLLSEKIVIIENTISGLEGLTWQYSDGISKEELKNINALISIAKDLGGKWKSEYENLLDKRADRFASEEIEEYGCSACDFIEVVEDLENIFFNPVVELRIIDKAS